MPAHAALTPLARVLTERILSSGPIPFAEYMTECLYHAEHGYYSRPEPRRWADYYTSVDVHPVFGRLVARQIREMWQVLGRPSPFCVVEAGAGAGRLAKHILDFFPKSFPEVYDALQYFAVEKSPARRAAHESLLGRHLAAGHCASLAELPDEVREGCIFSNELLDALPVHRVVQKNGELKEIFVGLQGGKFCDWVGPVSSAGVKEYFREQGIGLQEGQQAEAGLAACRWVEDAGRRLRRGFLMTMDYGGEARELYNDRHRRGTLLAYKGHRADEEFYRAPGEQDLTAHVNWTAIDLWGRRSGLARAGIASQCHFLLALARASDFADLEAPGQNEIGRFRTRLLFKNLIHPEGIGETFQVLIQHKAVGAPALAGLAPL